MDKQEVLLAEVKDAFGLIRVLEVGDYRFLEFGAAVEQSCVFTRDPSWLEYDYTRAMLMGGLMHGAPETALFLGLGAGTLTQACLEFLPLEDVEAIAAVEGIVALKQGGLQVRALQDYFPK